MQNHFNLIYENWIPVAGEGRVSLERIFKDSSLKGLGGTPIQKISVLKLLLGIAQAAYTPEDDEAWMRLGPEGMAEKCLKYLYEKEDRFWLYGDKPFLQMKGLSSIKVNQKGKAITKYKHFRPYLPDVSSTNDTILFNIQIDRALSDGDRTLLLISLMNYSPGGKRVEDIGPLYSEYAGKGTSAKAGPSLGGFVGYLNTCLWSDTIINTVYANQFTKQSIKEMGFWQDLSIVPPWENMPKHENDAAAKRIQQSIYGSLCALSRFVLFTDDGMIYAEGLQYPSHKNGWRESFFSWNNKEQFLWLDTEKKPWRNLVSLLNFPMNGNINSYQCPQVNFFWNRGRNKLPVMGIWSGGLQVRGTAGDQSVKQKDDFIESTILIPADIIGKPWFSALSEQIAFLENLSRILYGAMKRYYSELNIQDSGRIPKAQYQYWEITENYLLDIVLYCEDDQKMEAIRKRCVLDLYTIFNEHCTSQTARQMTSWAKNRPRVRTDKIKVQEETFAEKTD